MPPKAKRGHEGSSPNGTHTKPSQLTHAPYAANPDFTATWKGHCFCGTIQFSLSGDPLLNVFCHCRSCQRLHGAPATLSSIYPKDKVHFSSGTESLVFWSPQRKRNGYIVPCKLTCAECHSPIGNEGERTMLMLPALIDFDHQDHPDDSEQSNGTSQEQKQGDGAGHKQVSDGKGQHEEGGGRLPEPFRPNIHQHYETRIRDIQDDLPKFAKEKNCEPLNKAAEEFKERSEREKKEKEEKKKKEEEGEEKDKSPKQKKQKK